MANKKIKENSRKITKIKSDLDLGIIKQMLDAAENNIRSVRTMLLNGDYSKDTIGMATSKSGDVVEGIFNGVEMIDKNNKKYSVATNYASKSKLVPGDLLKLTITDSGSFIYKQIGPVERKNVIGILRKSADRYFVEAEGKNYNVLTASVTYFKAEPGDKLTIVVPKNRECDWAAVENIINK